MRLFIAPKRDVALSISKALGGPTEPTGAFFSLDDDRVTWLSGHLLRLGNPQEYDDRYETWSLDDLPMNWPISYLPDDRHKNQLAAVIELAKQADELVNAGDPDPEGQRLVDEVIEFAGLESKPMTRLLINDNNPMAILKASLSMRSNKDYRGLSLSALARSVCDQRYGFNLTRAYTLLARQQGYIGVLSVGRVQTPILGLIVARDKAHDAHIPVGYYDVVADVSIRNQTIRCRYYPLQAKLDSPASGQLDLVNEVLTPDETKLGISNKADADSIVKAIADEKVSVVSVDTDDLSCPPPLPHSLLSLQAEAAGQFAYHPSRVHEIAQRLRDEHMAITYHRSDSRYLNNERFREAPALIQALSADYAALTDACDKSQRSEAFNSDKVSAHHAIIPTLNVPGPDRLSEDERRIFDLILRAYLAQFYKDEVVRETSVIFKLGNYQFKSVGHVSVQKGWRDLLGDKFETDGLGVLSVGNEFGAADVLQNLESITRFDHGKVTEAESINKSTIGPQHYTMKTLLQDLTRVAHYVTDPAIKKLLLEKDSAKQDEAGGIGTPATRDKHIETLFNRGFIADKETFVTSTKIGKDFHDALPEFAVKPDMTALWHDKQKQIESGLMDYQTFISDVDTIIADEVSRAKLKGLKIKVKPVDCPVCKKGHLVLRTSKAKQQFWGCSIFPECRTTFSDVKGKPDF
jgi:DNA topoisomerase-3